MHLIGQLLLAQVQALTVVSMRIAVLEPQLARELALELQLEREPPVVRARELGSVLVLVQALAQELELARAAAPESRQAWKLRVSRQREQQQHRLQAAVQELLPCQPVLPMKAPC